MSKIGIKPVAFFALFTIQIVVVLVYKFSQTNGKYNYSTVSVMAMVETTKFFMSLCWTFWFSTSGKEIPTYFSQKDNLSQRLNKYRQEIQGQINTNFLFHTFNLAFLYGVNNQITFALFQYVDVVPISLFRSFISFQSALVLWLCFSRPISRIQWCAIALQVIGLVIVQYDPSKKLPTLGSYFSMILLINCSISSICTVWHEYLLKTYSVSLSVQNLVLSSFGSLVNFFLFVFIYLYVQKSPKEFFEEYSIVVLAAIFCNSILRLCITIVYKYADAITKTFSSACATGALLFLNWSVFEQPLDFTAGLGAAVIFISSYIYFLSTSRLSASCADTMLTRTKN